jgi:hypothetical protein
LSSDDSLKEIIFEAPAIEAHKKHTIEKKYRIFSNVTTVIVINENIKKNHEKSWYFHSNSSKKKLEIYRDEMEDLFGR